MLECDASARAVAGIVVSVSAGMDFNGIQIHRELDERERRYSSCLRELLGYAHSVRTLAAEHPAHLRGRVLEIVGDSKASSYVFAKGGSQCADAESGELLIFEALLDILAAAEAGSFEVIVRWVPREMIVDADALSKVKDTMDFSLAPAMFDHVVKTYGPSTSTASPPPTTPSAWSSTRASQPWARRASTPIGKIGESARATSWATFISWIESWT